LKQEILSDKCTLYCGDCMEVMAILEPKSVDLCLTDPPYGINADKDAFKHKGKNGRHLWEDCSDWDAKRPDKAIFDKILEVNKEQIIWGGNYFCD